VRRAARKRRRKSCKTRFRQTHIFKRNFPWWSDFSVPLASVCTFTGRGPLDLRVRPMGPVWPRARGPSSFTDAGRNSEEALAECPFHYFLSRRQSLQLWMCIRFLWKVSRAYLGQNRSFFHSCCSSTTWWQMFAQQTRQRPETPKGLSDLVCGPLRIFKCVRFFNWGPSILIILLTILSQNSYHIPLKIKLFVISTIVQFNLYNVCNIYICWNINIHLLFNAAFLNENL